MNKEIIQKSIVSSLGDGKYKLETATMRGIRSLMYKHEDFLQLVKDHGKGRIHLRYVNDKFAELVFQNKEKKNCITGSMMFQFAEVVDQLMLDVETKQKPVCLMIRGEGAESFSSGADLQLVKDHINSPIRGEMMSRYMVDALESLRNSGIISVCAVNGLALGGGSELTTVGDFRIISDNPNHYISFFHAKIGAMPGWGGLNRLVSIVGRKNAIKMCGASAQVFAEEGLQMGLIDKIVSIKTEDDWAPVAQDFFSAYLEQKYHKSVMAMKHTIAAVDTLSQAEAHQRELSNFKKRWYADDHARFMSTIENKRKPAP